MKNIIFVAVFLIIVNCSSKKVSNSHGFKYVKTKYDKITINKTNKNDLRELIGPPSSMSQFEDLWFYIERKQTNQSLIKLGKRKIIENNVIIISFNNKGLVKKKDILNVNDMNEIKIAEKVTKKKFSQNNSVYNIFSTLREKINAPTRNRKNN